MGRIVPIPAEFPVVHPGDGKMFPVAFQPTRQRWPAGTRAPAHYVGTLAAAEGVCFENILLKFCAGSPMTDFGFGEASSSSNGQLRQHEFSGQSNQAGRRCVIATARSRVDEPILGNHAVPIPRRWCCAHHAAPKRERSGPHFPGAQDPEVGSSCRCQRVLPQSYGANRAREIKRSVKPSRGLVPWRKHGAESG